MRPKLMLWILSMSGALMVSGCGQAVLAHKLNALNARFENRLQMTPGNLPPLVAGQPYSAQLGASGGVVPYHWRILEGDLPAGLALDAASGTISGVPAGVVRQLLVVQLTDSSGDPRSYVFASIHFETVGGGGQ